MVGLATSMLIKMFMFIVAVAGGVSLRKAAVFYLSAQMGVRLEGNMLICSPYDKAVFQCELDDVVNTYMMCSCI